MRMVIRVATGEFLYGGFYDPAPPSTGTDANGEPIPDAAFAVVTVPGDRPVDVRAERYDGAAPARRRPATGPELTAFDASARAARFSATSRQKDVLATCALIVRARGITAWNAMTVQQKKDATLAEADVWTNIRDFIETNL
jgi:hypothetical protein